MLEITPDQITAGFAAAEGTPAPEPAAPAAPAPDPVAPAEPTTYPWEADVQGLGLSPEHQAALNDYLSQKWQPRMTDFETRTKAYLDQFGGNEDHMALMSQMYQEFAEDPEKAFIKMGVEMGYLDPADLPEGTPVEPPTIGTPAEPAPAALPPQYQQWLDEKMASEAEAAQEAQLEAYFAEVGKQFGETFDKDLYHKLFVGTLGNEELALETYQKYQDALSPPEPTPTAPKVLSEGTGTTQVTNTPAPKTIDEAMALFVAQQEAAKNAR